MAGSGRQTGRAGGGRADLTPLRFSELVLGAALPGNLYDERGQVLARAGKVLDEHDLPRLSRFLLHHGPDWPTTESETEPTLARPAEVIDQLARQRADAASEKSERRNAKRHTWKVPLTLDLTEHTAGGLVQRRINVTTRDVSRSGFGFLFSQFVHPGTQVLARVDALPNKPVLRGVVRNCVNVGATNHRVGVLFLEAKRADEAA